MWGIVAFTCGVCLSLFVRSVYLKMYVMFALKCEA